MRIWNLKKKLQLVFPDKIVMDKDSIWGYRFPKVEILSLNAPPDNIMRKTQLANSWVKVENTISSICVHLKIWYNDVKPDNIAVVNNEFKLIDLDSFVPANAAASIKSQEWFTKFKEKCRTEIQDKLGCTYNRE